MCIWVPVCALWLYFQTLVDKERLCISICVYIMAFVIWCRLHVLTVHPWQPALIPSVNRTKKQQEFKREFTILTSNAKINSKAPSCKLKDWTRPTENKSWQSEQKRSRCFRMKFTCEGSCHLCFSCILIPSLPVSTLTMRWEEMENSCKLNPRTNMSEDISWRSDFFSSLFKCYYWPPVHLPNQKHMEKKDNLVTVLVSHSLQGRALTCINMHHSAFWLFHVDKIYL